MLRQYYVDLDFDLDAIDQKAVDSLTYEESVEYLNRGLEGCPLNVMNVMECVDHFMTFHDSFAEFYVKTVFPFFEECQWKWGGTEYSGWELKRDGIVLSMKEVESDDMDTEDQRLYFPKLCEFIYNAMTGGNADPCSRIYHYIVRASAVDQVSTQPSWPDKVTDAELKRMEELRGLIRSFTASDNL